MRLEMKWNKNLFICHKITGCVQQKTDLFLEFYSDPYNSFLVEHLAVSD